VEEGGATGREEFKRSRKSGWEMGLNGGGGGWKRG